MEIGVLIAISVVIWIIVTIKSGIRIGSSRRRVDS